MLNRSPSSYRTFGDDPRVVSTKKVLPRRPWYAPPIEHPDPVSDYSPDYGRNDYGGNSHSEDDYDATPEYVDPVKANLVEAQEQLLDIVTTEPAVDATSTNSVSEFSIASGVNLREAALVALGGACAALVLLIIMAGVFVARRRKNSPSPAPSPPILVYPPHDIATPCYMTKEVNFSLPTLRSTSLGELRDVVSVSSLGSEVLIPPMPSQHRSNSFSKYYDVALLAEECGVPEIPRESAGHYHRNNNNDA